MVMPQPGNQTRFVGAADLFDRIKACNFLGTRPPRAVGRSLPAGLSQYRQRPCSTVLLSLVLASSWAVLLSRSRCPASGLDRDCVARPRPGWDCGCRRAPRPDGWKAARDPDEPAPGA